MAAREVGLPVQIRGVERQVAHWRNQQLRVLQVGLTVVMCCREREDLAIVPWVVLRDQLTVWPFHFFALHFRFRGAP